MSQPRLNIRQLGLSRPLLLTISIAGFVLINVPFVYIALMENEIYQAALSNGIALIFMAEAFLLMMGGAFLIWFWQIRKPGWLVFILLSLFGGLAFSIPLFLYLHSNAAGFDSADAG
jgi:hypothetical protein